MFLPFTELPSNNIALQRVVQSMKHRKRVDHQPALKEGWLVSAEPITKIKHPTLEKHLEYSMRKSL